jgi:hypothetical protein
MRTPRSRIWCGKGAGIPFDKLRAGFRLRGRVALRLVRFAQEDIREGHIEMIELKSMAVAMPEVVGHPNRREFQGVLTVVDMPSQQAPSGAKGHLVVLTKQAAEAALPSLLGMALDYSPSLDRHDVRRKVGVITRAEIIGRNLELGGYLFARDFPEIVEEIGKAERGGNRRLKFRRDKQLASGTVQAGINGGEPWGWIEGYKLRSSLRTAAKRIRSLASATRQGARNMQLSGFCWTIRAEARMTTAGVDGLGLSYEVTDVQVADTRAQVWSLAKVTFTGAAILRRDKAAYRNTWIELSS